MRHCLSFLAVGLSVILLPAVSLPAYGQSSGMFGNRNLGGTISGRSGTSFGGGLGGSGAPNLDNLIHGRIRLGIMSALAVNDVLSFPDLKQILDTTDGNLSVHARKLEAAGYLQCKKYFAGRQPRTDYRLTAAGRNALERYLGHMEALIAATRGKQ